MGATRLLVWNVLGVIVAAYNRLVALSPRVSQTFADIDVQLKQCHDRIPNLVETMKAMPRTSAER